MNLNPSSMPTSEIDDIFSAKGKAKALESLAPLPSVDEKEEKKKKKKPKKRKDKLHPSDKTDEIDRSTVQKRPAPETVVDPSSKSSISSKRPKLDVSASSQHVKPSHDKRKEDEDRFKDSRGAAPRRKTDDGFNIYKEDELGISNYGGDTRLCPFDCNCCF